MSKKFYRLVRSQTYKLDDQTILNYKNIPVFFCFDNYDNDVQHILELASTISTDLGEDIPKNRMLVHTLNAYDAHGFAGYTAILVSLPAETFIRLRNENKISIL